MIVVDTPQDQEIAESVKNRKPRRGWGKPSEVTTLTVSGLPAARSTTRPHATVFRRGEITGVFGEQVFYFIATYQLGDRNAGRMPPDHDHHPD